MRKIRFAGVPIVLFGIAWIGAMGFVVVWLWNMLMPAIFSLPVISFWQALGLFLLSRVLFGRSGGWHRRMAKARFVRGWKDLTPDERQRFRRAMDFRGRGDCGAGQAPEQI
jgi:hypothetical protein